MDVSACPRCASPDIRQATVSDGVVAGPGELLLSICHRCGFRGAPLLFDNEDMYEDFRKAVQEGAGTPVEEDAMPPQIEEAIALPLPRRPLATAAVMGAIGVALALSGVVALGSSILALSLGSVNVYGLLMGAFALALAFVFGRSCVRLWGRPAGHASG